MKNSKKEDIEVIHGIRVFDKIDSGMSHPLCRLSLHFQKVNVCLASKWLNSKRKQDGNNARRSLTANIKYTNVFHI